MGTPIVPTSGLQEQRTCLYGRVWRFFIGEEATVSLMLRAETSCRYSITLYQWVTETSRWGLWDIHACALSTEPSAAYPPVGHLPRSIFWRKFVFQICIIRITELYSLINCELSCSIFAVELIYTVIFQQTRCKPAKLNSVVCLEISWNVPVGLCLHILPGAFLYFRDGSWRDLQRGAWKRSVLLTNVFQACWISQ